MPTNVRFHVIGATTLAAVILYLDRICIGEIVKLTAFRNALSLSEEKSGAILSAFFFSYALGQVPAGWLSDRFGARKMLPAYICIWSVCTILTGLAMGFAMLMAARLLFGFAQAGCYPTASSVIKRWIPARQRGRASSIVSFGGRLGGTIAPALTAMLLKDYLSWRWVLALYGTTGLFAAIHFWWVFRDAPEEHPAVNKAELGLIAAGEEKKQAPETPAFPPLLPLICSGTMWAMSLMQFGVCFGWVFLVTSLPTYLQDVRGVDPGTGGWMSTIVLACGIVGMLCGGPLTDAVTVRLGRRWGRTLPLVACYCVAIGAYLFCLSTPSVWAFVAAMSCVAFATDLSVPGIWAYMQDVGGKNSAAVFGWGNMWGNFGAAVTPLVIPLLRKYWDPQNDWRIVFCALPLGFLVAAIAALGLNPDRKIE